MSNNKFFIGLGATVPSTRVIKPPGGDCSDLFGLKTRQKTQIKSLKGTSSVIDYLLRQQSDDSHLKKYASKSASLSLVTSKDTPRITPSSTLSSSQNGSDLVNYLNSPTESVADLSAHKINAAKELSYFDIDSVGDNFEGLNIKDNCGLSSESIQENLKATRQNSELSYLGDKSYDNARQTRASDMTLNSSVMTKTRLSTNNSFANSDTSAESGMSINKEQEKKFIHNPITGALTEIKSWRKSNPVISRKSSMQETKSKTSESKMSTSSKAILVEPVKASSSELTRRNPITGEGILADPHLPGIPRSRIRVIHPPGGISSGPY